MLRIQLSLVEATTPRGTMQPWSRESYEFHLMLDSFDPLKGTRALDICS